MRGTLLGLGFRVRAWEVQELLGLQGLGFGGFGV